MNIKRVTVVLLLIVLLAAIILLPTYIKSIQDAESIEVVEQACRLNDGPCAYLSSLFGLVRVEITPSDFPAFKPLSIAVDAESPLVKGIRVSLQGQDMFMGPNSVSLTNMNQGEWGGTVTIPVCSIDASMVWLVKLTLLGDANEQLVFKVKSGEVKTTEASSIHSLKALNR